MIKFRNDIYSDVRIERMKRVNIMSNIDENIENKFGTYIRVYNGIEWINDYIDEIKESNIQDKLNELYASIKEKNVNNLESYIRYLPKNSLICPEEKYVSYSNDNLIKNYINKEINSDNRFGVEKVYSEYYINKQIITSTGLYHKYTYKLYGFGTKIQEKSTGKSLRFLDSYNSINEISNNLYKIPKFLEYAKSFLLNSSIVKPGKYKILLAPEVSGLYCHECFGHLLEHDCFLTINNNLNHIIHSGLNIVDDGMLKFGGYCPFDDEGMLSQKTYIITKGKITSLLHNMQTSILEKCIPTGNARAVGYKNKPIIRMTNTYIEPTQTPFKQILSSIDKGIYVKSVNDGYFDGKFMFDPELCYEINNGSIGNPIRVNKIIGTIKEMHSNIVAIGDDLKFTSSLFGGCYKDEQYPLMMSYGAPHILLDKIYVE